MRKKFPSEETIKQNRRFKSWCESKGYFPHTKYLEAWMAALNWREDDATKS